MSDTKFTPGLWVISSSTLICTPHAKMIANAAPAIGTDLGLHLDECRANARIIVKSPEMHGLLKAFIAATEGVFECGHIRDDAMKLLKEIES